jgi:hypothetical protein
VPFFYARNRKPRWITANRTNPVRSKIFIMTFYCPKYHSTVHSARRDRAKHIDLTMRCLDPLGKWWWYQLRSSPSTFSCSSCNRYTNWR